MRSLDQRDHRKLHRRNLMTKMRARILPELVRMAGRLQARAMSIQGKTP